MRTFTSRNIFIKVYKYKNKNIYIYLFLFKKTSVSYISFFFVICILFSLSIMNRIETTNIYKSLFLFNVGRGDKRGPETYIDPAMIGVLVGMALMFIIICVVLRLFSQWVIFLIFSIQKYIFIQFCINVHFLNDHFWHLLIIYNFICFAYCNNNHQHRERLCHFPVGKNLYIHIYVLQFLLNVHNTSK